MLPNKTININFKKIIINRFNLFNCISYLFLYVLKIRPVLIKNGNVITINARTIINNKIIHKIISFDNVCISNKNGNLSLKIKNKFIDKLNDNKLLFSILKNI